jgi:hypothetical protein
MQPSGFWGVIQEDSELDKIPGVNGVMAPLRPIPNSVVKRYCGEDSWGVAPCENSSMPGLYFSNKKIPSNVLEGIFLLEKGK